MRILVTLTLLFFELFSIKAHAVPVSDTSLRDVYEVQELGQPKTTFTAPKAEKPTLREIVFYHVVERPYGEKIEHHADPEPLQIDLDETMRPFTNGHGYQFADTDLHETENHDVSAQSDSEESSEEQPTAASEEDGEEDTSEDSSQENDPDDKSSETPEVSKTAIEKSTEKPELTTPSEEKKNKIRQRQFLFDRLRERYSASFKKTTTTEKMENVTTTTEKIENTEKPEVSTTSEEPKNMTSTPASTKVRSKRSINHDELPVAPTLPPLDYSKYPGLPVFLGLEPVYPETDNSNPDDLKQAMEFKINDIFATMKPHNDDDGQDNDNDIRIATHRPERKVRTYGMNLSEDQGTVWNNMWRPINYHVGEPVKLYDVNEYQVSTIAPFEEEATTQAPITTTETPTTTTTTTTLKPDIEDIYVDVKKPTINHKLQRKPTTEKPEEKNEPNREEEQEAENKEDKEQDGDKIISKSLIRHNKKPSDMSQEKPIDDAKPDLYEQLINSDRFWKWLAHWTSNYMEVLSDRVKDMVKKEVETEMKKYEKSHSNDRLNKTKDERKPDKHINGEKDPNKTVITPNKEPIMKNNTIIIDGKEIPLTNTSNFDKGNTTFDKNFIKRHRDRDEKNPSIDKINDKKPDNNKTIAIQPNATKHEENYNNVKAENIYGSSTGNDKVTNIFIFYPGTDSEKIIDGLKPYLNNSNSGMATFIQDKNEEDKKDKVTEEPEKTTANKDSVKSTPKPIENENLNKTEESKPTDNKNSTKLEENKDQNGNPEKDVIKPETSTEKDKEITESKGTTEIPTSTESPNSNSTEISTEQTMTTETAATQDSSTTIGTPDSISSEIESTTIEEATRTDASSTTAAP